MATELKLRRGTTAQHENFTGANAEVTVDTDKNTIVVHDGSTPGGFPIESRPLVQQPENISPADNATSILPAVKLEASDYGSLYNLPMASAQWQISEVSDFSTTVVDDTVSGTSTTYTPSTNLDPGTNYFWRVRYTDNNGDQSDFSEVTSFETSTTFTAQPTITAPADGATDIAEQPVIDSSAFNTVNGSDTHVASQWVITRVSDSVEVFDSGEDTSNLESIQVPSGVLDEGEENYTVKVRHKGDTYGFSAYSPEITFTTATVFLPAIGDAFAGGFFAGIIDTIAGTIDSSDDYQTGERYALIVSPKSLESAQEWQTVPSSRSGTLTRWDGLSSTNVGIASNNNAYEAFFYIDGLRTSDPVPNDGGSDWYLPAMDELELLYRNFKPTTAANSTFTYTSGFFAPQDSGFNPSSDPTSSAYVANDPLRTTVTEFQNGNSEAMDNTVYWSSTDPGVSGGGTAMQQGFTASGDEGRQIGSAQGTPFTVRPVRRFPV